MNTEKALDFLIGASFSAVILCAWLSVRMRVLAWIFGEKNHADHAPDYHNHMCWSCGGMFQHQAADCDFSEDDLLCAGCEAGMVRDK
jgi:hypothetical protein